MAPAVGEYTTPKVRASPGANVLGSAGGTNSAKVADPEVPTELTVRESLPVLVTTMDNDLLVATSTLPKSRLDGAKVARGEMPVPLSVTAAAGFARSLLWTIAEALRAPIAVGVKDTPNAIDSKGAKVV